MRYASLTKLGGELIEADRADYDDYKGFLRCPECGEPVFLRKSHTRQSPQRVSAVGGTAIAVPSQLITVPSAFVHHQAVPEVSVCEFRVGGYTEAEVEYRRSVSRDQRLRKLQVSMWKYLKSNKVFDLSHYSSRLRDMQTQVLFNFYVKEATEKIKSSQWRKDLLAIGGFFDNYLQSQIDFDNIPANTKPSSIFKEELDIGRAAMRVKYQSGELLFEMTNYSDWYYSESVSAFLRARKRDWSLHCQIAKEALAFMLKSCSMEKILERLLACICEPTIFDFVMSFWERSEFLKSRDERYAYYINQYLTAIFAFTDWIDIFGAGQVSNVSCLHSSVADQKS